MSEPAKPAEGSLLEVRGLAKSFQTGQGEIEVARLLREVDGRQTHGDGAPLERDARVGDRMADALAALPRRGLRESGDADSRRAHRRDA